MTAFFAIINISTYEEWYTCMFERNRARGKPKKRLLEHWHVITLYLMLYDAIAVNAAYFIGLWIRFDCRYSQIPAEYFHAFLKFSPWYTIFCLVVFRLLKLYNSVWRFASYRELQHVTAATIITSLFQLLGITLILRRMPVSYYLVGTVLQFGLIVMVRFSYRFILLERNRRRKDAGNGTCHRAMIIGAGGAGRLVVDDIMKSMETRVTACCIIDDNPNKWGRYINGIPIVGGRDDILVNAEKYQVDQILFAIPTATPEEKRDILNICKESGCELKILPGIYQLVNGDVTLKRMKDVAVEDLLGRNPIKVNLSEIFQHLKGKTILVTGGGGSIGSELCRQIAAHEPKKLIIFDIYENNAYDIEQELKAKYPGQDIAVLIGSVRDSRRIGSVFEMYKPQIVYHAAAHKHVPLMETSPCEAIKNNVLGTYKTAYAAMKNGCERFVLISTDKAVNPTNIMGASKRLCEMVIQSMDMISRSGREDLLPMLQFHEESDSAQKLIDELKMEEVLDWAETIDMASEQTARTDSDSAEGKRRRTEFVAVRFGNVLGSNGSVIPLFKKQIEQGGPVTVTHPDIIRYFMSIPEAVSLVLQAGTYAHGGEIFVLDMGVPMKIDTLARNLIKLSGYKPDEEIKITYTGLRPGEKLYEEKLMAEEGLERTPNELIHIGKPIPFHVPKFLEQLEELARASYCNDPQIEKLVAEAVPTYHSPEDDLKNCRRKYEALYYEVCEAEESEDTEEIFV